MSHGEPVPSARPTGNTRQARWARKRCGFRFGRLRSGSHSDAGGESRRSGNSHASSCPDSLSADAFEIVSAEWLVVQTRSTPTTSTRLR